MLNFFKTEKTTKEKNISVTSVACLLIHAAKIDENYSNKEKEIIKQKNIIEKNKFDEQVNKLREEIKLYNEKKKVFNEEINSKKLKYTKIVLNKLNPIISSYVEKNSISIVLPKKSVIIAKKKLDITDQIMDLLNKELTKINF